MNTNDKIIVAGGRGTLGLALSMKMEYFGYDNVIIADLPDIDLTDLNMTDRLFAEQKPKYVFFCAAFIGGIQFKLEHPAEIFSINMRMLHNIFECAKKYDVVKLLSVGSALLYPSDAPLPSREASIQQISPSGADAPYMLIKFIGVKMCEYYHQQYGCNYFTVIPCNFFGPNAPFDGNKAGVVPSLIRRMHEAKTSNIPQVVVWGSGNAGRDFLGVDDVADACLYVMNHYLSSAPLNIGSGYEITIKQAAETIKDVVGYQGELVFDTTKPEGRRHMLLDTSNLKNLGWVPKTSFRASVQIAYNWYQNVKR